MAKRCWLLLLGAVLLLAGCASIGPGSVNRDRFDYNTALSESWKRQILLNVVKLRYVEPLCFVDVGQIVAGYSLETGVNVGARREFHDTPGPDDLVSLEAGGSGKYTDRPTITYVPMTGAAFLRGVMLPIPAHNIMLNIQSGVSADIILSLTVGSINGLRNEATTTAGYRPADARFLRSIQLIRALQLSGALRIKAVKPLPGQEVVAYVSFPAHNVPAETAAQISELRDLLGLDPAAERYALIQGPASTGQEIALQSYSLMQVLAALSVRVDVPDEDVISHRAVPGLSEEAGRLNPNGARIRFSDSEPGADAFVKVPFRGHWFWVDDHDLATKRVFSFILLAFTLLDETKRDSVLQLTVPTQ